MGFREIKNIKIFPFIQITRPLNLLIVESAVYLGFFISSGSYRVSLKDILLFLPISLSAAAGYCLNDLTDLEEDRLNRPNRVLVKKIISKKTCVIFLSALVLISLSVSLFKPILLLTNILILFFVLIYDFYLKKTPLAGNVLTSCLGSSPVLWGSLVPQKTDLSPALCVFFLAFLLHLNRETVKDIEDYKGDLAAGKNTTAVFLGLKYSRFLVVIFHFILFACAILVFIKLFGFSPKTFVFSSPLFFFIFTSLVSSIKSKFTLSSLFLRLSMASAVACLFFLFS
ncbi:UbiA family prenyltransferase [candidate division WOR-3 bacterium]|nr:UbiA family prenyltransferase [candidate division WOR-3 bacterium]